MERGGGEFRTQVNLLLVMGLVGLWHGAKWTFVIWGLYYGVLMCLARIRKVFYRRQKVTVSVVGTVSRVLLVFNLTALAALFFRAPDLLTVCRMAGASWQTAAGPRWGPDVLPLLLLAVLLHFAPERWKEGAENLFINMPPLVQGALAALVVGLLVTVGGAADPYYYFQF